MKRDYKNQDAFDAAHCALERAQALTYLIENAAGNYDSDLDNKKVEIAMFAVADELETVQEFFQKEFKVSKICAA